MSQEDRGSQWTLSEHCEQYNRAVKAHYGILLQAWEDLELPNELKLQKLLSTAAAAEQVWTDAIQEAESQREAARELIESSQLETSKLRSQLCDEEFEDVGGSPQRPSSGRSMTLKAQLTVAQRELNLWRTRKAQRVQKFEALKVQCTHLREQMGLPVTSLAIKSVTIYALEGLALDLQKLQAEQTERQHSLELLLRELRKACLAVGEDEHAAAGAVHASLAADAQSGPLSGQDLSDRTFEGLRKKTKSLQELAEHRQQQGENLLATLDSLWDALDTPKDDLDRELFARLMSGPARLHQATMDKCLQEIARLEGARKDLMLSIIEAKRQQLAAICAESHMRVPESHTSEGSEVSEVLAKVLRQVSTASAEAERRKDVLHIIEALEAAMVEVEWLVEYEGDADRYKGRDANRKIKKAISAGKQREQLPGMVARASSALQEFRDQEGRSFAYDGHDYQTEVLEPLKQRLSRQDEARKTPAVKGPKPGQTPSKRVHQMPPTTPRTKPAAKESREGGQRRGGVATPAATPAAGRRRTDTGTERLDQPLASASKASAPLTDKLNRLLQSAATTPPNSAFAARSASQEGRFEFPTTTDQAKPSEDTKISMQGMSQQNSLNSARSKLTKLDIGSNENQLHSMPATITPTSKSNLMRTGSM